MIIVRDVDSHHLPWFVVIRSSAAKFSALALVIDPLPSHGPYYMSNLLIGNHVDFNAGL